MIGCVSWFVGWHFDWLGSFAIECVLWKGGLVWIGYV